MKISIALLLIISLFMGVTGVGMRSVSYANTQKQMAHAYHKALQTSMYFEDESIFETVFYSNAPKHLNYRINLKGTHEYPRLRNYEVVGWNDQYELVFSETMIEEKVYE